MLHILVLIKDDRIAIHGIMKTGFLSTLQQWACTLKQSRPVLELWASHFGGSCKNSHCQLETFSNKNQRKIINSFKFLTIQKIEFLTRLGIRILMEGGSLCVAMLFIQSSSCQSVSKFSFTLVGDFLGPSLHCLSETRNIHS